MPIDSCRRHAWLMVLIAVSCVGCRSPLRTDRQESPVAVVDLGTEYRIEPLGLDAPRPRLSWRLASSRRGTLQTRYRIRIAADATALTQQDKLLWDSGEVPSGESIQVAYNGPALQARSRYVWQVRVWDEHGDASPWSAPAAWEMGLLAPEDWTARWIEPAASSEQAPFFRRDFALRGAVIQARLYATSHGLYRLFLNGRRVGNAELTPGFTNYNQQLQYQTYDVTLLLKQGNNAVGAIVGEGWYSGELGYLRKRNFYGDRLGLLLQLEVTYTDGTTERIGTDSQWKSATGPILMSNIYAGETYDARLEHAGWDRADFDDSRWTAVKIGEHSMQTLVAQIKPLTGRIQNIVPKRVSRKSTGWMVDMGQNMAGWVRLTVEGPAGSTVTLRHGEMLDANGGLYTGNLMGAAQTVRYTLKGQGVEVYEPHFTYQGFRYVEIEGYPGELTPQRITGVVVHADLEPAGQFATSNPLLNQLQHNIVWSLKSNFVAIPSDNPQRSERFGWTADAQLFAPTAAFNADVAGFFAGWLKDVAADQRPSGGIPWVVPDVFSNAERVASSRFIEQYGRFMTPSPSSSTQPADGASAAVWGDVATVLPWMLYMTYGDRRVLEDQYESMRRWVEYERQRAGEDLIWSGDFQFGDWLDFGSDVRQAFGATNTDLIATAYFAHSVDLLSRAARVLERQEDALRYEQLFAAIRAAFQRAFVNADTSLGAGTQTPYVLALQFDLLPVGARAAAAKHLVENVRRQGHLTTGLAGTPWLLFALSKYGYVDDAYGLLLREEYPSWLYTVKLGATSMWERWDGVKPDGTAQDLEMNSFNQYVYGAVGAWMYRTIAGIDLAAPGYKHISIAPQPGGDLTFATASYLTPYGEAVSSWRIDGDAFELTVQIPPNATATVKLPAARQNEVFESGRHLNKADGISAPRQDGANTLLEVGSGRYVFSYRRH